MGPREQLERAPCAEDVPADALLAVLLRSGVRGCDVLELSRRLLKAFGGDIGAMVHCDWRTLQEKIAEYNRAHLECLIAGVGKVKILELAAAFELARRGLKHAAPDWQKLTLTAETATGAYALFAPLVVGDEQENFLVLPVDARHHPMCDPIRITRGTQDRTPVHPREVFREAIRWGAHAVIVAHNHPVGDPTPSEDDLQLTRRLVEVARLLAIPLLDHLILGAPGSGPCGQGFVSIRSGRQCLFN